MMEKNRIRENEMLDCAKPLYGLAKRRKQPERYVQLPLKWFEYII
jgi:hypothetical protein